MTWVGKEQVIQLLSGIVAIFSVNNLFPFPLATALLIGDVMTNRWSGVKMFLSVITAPIVLAELIDILIRWSYVNPPMFEYSFCKFDSPCLFNIWIRLRQYIGAVMVSSYWPKFPALRLFVETMPIHNAVATGNRNIEFYRETARSNCKKPSIATKLDRTWITVFFPTPLIFRYHLPLKQWQRLLGKKETIYLMPVIRNRNFIIFRVLQIISSYFVHWQK